MKATISLLKLIQLIDSEINNLNSSPNYYASEPQIDAINAIYSISEYFGFIADDHSEYLIKASEIEQLNYIKEHLLNG